MGSHLSWWVAPEPGEVRFVLAELESMKAKACSDTGCPAGRGSGCSEVSLAMGND